MVNLSAAKPVIVMSMHRSGSSFVASLLHASGIHMGTRLMAAGPDNPLGFFENLDFVNFHERWLRLNGYDRAGWAAPQQIQLSGEARDEAFGIVERSDVARVWGWKDPRTTLFDEFWSGVLPDARYIMLYREPTEVIGSLLRRHDPPIVAEPELAAQAWLSHNTMLLQAFGQRRPRAVLVNIAAIARDSRRFLQLVADRFDVDINVNVPTTFERELLSRVTATDGKFMLLRHLHPECGKLYADLEASADLPAGFADTVPPTPSGARRAFYADWLNELAGGAAPRRPLSLPKTTEFDEPETSTDPGRVVLRAQRVLDRHKRALSEFKHSLGEE